MGTQLSLATLLVLLGGCAFSDLKPLWHLLEPTDASQTLADSNQPLSPAAWPAANWWSSFKDPQLDNLVREALADSPILRSAAARVQQNRRESHD